MRKEMALLGMALVLGATSVRAAHPILGEVEITPASRVERDAGVWVDGQYVGYVKNLQGKDKLVLVPGEHELTFRLAGYQEGTHTIVVEPGGQQEFRVAMAAAPNVTYPEEGQSARLRVSVEPEEAAVFVNDAYVGHVDRFNGHRGMTLAPGTYKFTIALPGYRAFHTELSVLANQTYEIKTELQPGSFDDQAGELAAQTGAEDTR